MLIIGLIDMAVEEGIVQKGGSWFSYQYSRLGQGRENSKQYIRENPDTALEIENSIRGKYSLPLFKIEAANSAV